MRYSIFLGCAIPSCEGNYELSARRVMDRFGVELEYLEGAACCGHELEPVDRFASQVWAARNLCLSEEKGLDMTVLCPSCYLALKKTNTELKEDPDARKAVNDVLGQLGREFLGEIEVVYWLDVIRESIGVDRLKEEIVKSFQDLDVAVHYGCHLLRPSTIVGFDDPVRPSFLDELVELTGARSIDYMDKTMCCGTPTLSTDMKSGLKIALIKLENMKRAGVELLVTACPVCHMMFDANQSWIENTFDEEIDLPVLHISQMLGLSMGVGYRELGLDRNAVDPSAVVEKMV